MTREVIIEKDGYTRMDTEVLRVITDFILRSPEATEEFQQWIMKTHPFPDHGEIVKERN